MNRVVDTGLQDRSLQLREAAAQDSEAVVELWKRCGLTRPWNDPYADFTKAMATNGSAVIVGLENNVIVASVMVGFDGHRGWVYYLAVDPHLRKRGHGTRMMDAAEKWLGDRGAAKLQLMVRENNQDVLSFYERLGMERQAVIVFGRWLR